MPPNGVSIRFPPAKGFAGSAVWQLPQSPASVSALPLAIVSGDGSAAMAGLDAVHKTRVTRIAGPPHRCCRIDRSPVFGSIAAKPALRRFAAAFFHDTTAKGERAAEHDIAFCVDAHPGRQICGAAGLKTDIDWHC